MTIASLIVTVGANVSGLENDIKKVHGSLDGIGGVASKMGGMLAGAFTIGAITSYAKAAFDTAGQIVDLAGKTGLSMRAIQEMAHAADQTGTSLDSFTTAAFKLGTNLDGGSSSVRSAVDKLGLSYETLKSQSPDKQFDAIAGALHRMESPQERNRLAVLLFGKVAGEILPAIAEDYLAIAADATVAGDKQLKAIDKAADAWNRLLKNLKSTFIQTVGSMALGYEQLGTGIDTLTDKERNHLAFLKKSGGDWSGYLDGVYQKHINVRLEQEGVRLATDRQARAAQGLVAVALPEHLGLEDLAFKKLTTSVNKAVEAQEKSQRAHEQFASSIKRLDTSEWYVPFKKTILEVENILEVLPSSGAIAERGLTKFKDAVKDTGTAVESFSQKLRAGLSAELQKIPQTIANSFTGGGGIEGALKATLSGVGAAVGGSLGFMIGGPMGASIGSAIGSMAGLIVNPLKKLFGFGVDEAAKAAAEAANKAAVALVAEFESKLAGFRTDLQGLIGKGAELGYVFDQAGNVVSVSFDKMRGVAGKYGTDLASLGPAFQSARLHDAAQTLVDDFWLLVHGGADVGAVLLGMSPQINTLVNDSIKFKTAIPENMKPWIQSLLDAGKLTDENGKKITDLSAIQFGDPVAAQYLTIQSAIMDLIKKIDDLITRISQIPTSRTLTLTTVYDSVDQRRRGDNGDIGDGFAYGSSGVRDFGRGTLTMLHGRERVQTESQMLAERGSNNGGGEALAEVRRLVRDLPRAMKLAVSDAMVMQGAR